MQPITRQGKPASSHPNPQAWLLNLRCIPMTALPRGTVPTEIIEKVVLWLTVSCHSLYPRSSSVKSKTKSKSKSNSTTTSETTSNISHTNIQVINASPMSEDGNVQPIAKFVEDSMPPYLRHYYDSESQSIAFHTVNMTAHLRHLNIDTAICEERRSARS